MTDLEKQLEHVRRLQNQFNQTLQQVKAKLTVDGLTDEAAALIVSSKSDLIPTSIITAGGAAWLFNRFFAKFNLDELFHFKTATSNKDIENHENANSRIHKRKSDGRRKARVAQGQKQGESPQESDKF